MPRVRAPLAALMLVGCGARTLLLPGEEVPAIDSGTRDAGPSGPDANPPVATGCAAASGQMVVLAPNQNPSGFAMDDAYLYWVDQGSQAVRRVPKLGGPLQTVATEPLDYAAFMAVDDADLYWTTGHQLWRAPKGGGGTPEMLAGDDATGVALDADNVYWSSDVRASIFQEAKSGGERITLATGQVQPEAVAVDGSFVYWVIGMPSSEPGVAKVPIGGGSITQLAAVSWGAKVALDDAHVYWTQVQIGDEFVARVSKDGGAVETIAPAQAPGGIAVDDTYLWWTDFGANTVSRTLKAGGATTVVASNQLQARELVADAGCVYWTTKSVSGVMGSVVAYGK